MSLATPATGLAFWSGSEAGLWAQRGVLTFGFNVLLSGAMDSNVEACIHCATAETTLLQLTLYIYNWQPQLGGALHSHLLLGNDFFATTGSFAGL
jgi:hypothetical protein